MCDFFCRHLFQWCWRRFFFLGDGVGELQIFWLKISHFPIFSRASKLEVGKWITVSNQTFVAVIPGWGGRWDETKSGPGGGKRLGCWLRKGRNSQGWCSFNFDGWLAMKEMFFLLTCTPAKLHNNGSHRFQEEIHLLSDSFWEKSFAILVYLESNTNISASVHLPFFQFRTLKTFKFQHLRSQLLRGQKQPFLDGGAQFVQMTNWQPKEIFSMSLSKINSIVDSDFKNRWKVDLWSVSRQSIWIDSVFLICHQFSFKEGLPNMPCYLNRHPTHEHSVRFSCYCLLVCILRQSLLDSHHWSDGNMHDPIFQLNIILRTCIPFAHHPSSRFVALLLNDAWHHQDLEFNTGWNFVFRRALKYICETVKFA